MQVGMDQMSVDKIWPKAADLAPQRSHQKGIQVWPRADHRVGYSKRSQSLREAPRPTRDRDAYPHLDAGLGEGREQ